MDRSYTQLYSKSNSSSVYSGGGSNSKQGKSKPSDKPSSDHSYRPADIDGETATALDKFRKANRLLKKELESVKEELHKEQQLTKELQDKLGII